eukprot:2850032-Prymnesium_polylepis.1
MRGSWCCPRMCRRRQSSRRCARRAAWRSRSTGCSTRSRTTSCGLLRRTRTDASRVGAWGALPMKDVERQGVKCAWVRSRHPAVSVLGCGPSRSLPLKASFG